MGQNHRTLAKIYGANVPTQNACVRWFIRSKSGNFDLKDKERLCQPKKFEDAPLQALLDEDNTKT